MSKVKSKYSQLLNFALLIGIIILVNVFSKKLNFSLDLTEEKRFTLTDATVDLLEETDEPIYAQLLLEGQLPAGFKRLQTAAIDMLEDFGKKSSGAIEFEIIDPGKGSVEQINEIRKRLSDDGVYPVNLQVMDANERSEQLVYPFIIFHKGNRTFVVNILENEALTINPQRQLNNSISLLEYKLSNAVNKLKYDKKKTILFLTGHRELNAIQLSGLAMELQTFYNTEQINLDSVYKIDQKVDLLIIAKPRAAFTERHKFILDQYIMKGGRVLWLIDNLRVELDSLRTNKLYVPFEYPLNLEDLFFKYGWRINTDLIQDLECTRIPVIVGQNGGTNQYSLMPFYYHPLAQPLAGHPITNNLDRVNLKFPSSLDTIKTKFAIKKSVILSSSSYSKFLMTPMQIGLEQLRHKPIIEKFNKPNLPVGLLLEGKFASMYENRVSVSMQKGLDDLNETFAPSVDNNRMIIVTDGDIARSQVKGADYELWPLGYNLFEQRNFGNKEFLLNCIEYLLDGEGVLTARTKEVKLRLLDVVRAQKEKSFWQVLNVAIPLFMLGLFGLFFNWRRKRKYAS